jgi:uncharacterized protein DUF3455
MARAVPSWSASSVSVTHRERFAEYPDYLAFDFRPHFLDAEHAELSWRCSMSPAGMTLTMHCRPPILVTVIRATLLMEAVSVRKQTRIAWVRRAAIAALGLTSTGLIAVAYNAQAAEAPAAGTTAQPAQESVLPPGAPTPGPKFRIFEMYAVTTGTQTYTCTDAGTFGTTSVPEATLVSSDGQHRIHHSAGPRWTDLGDRSRLLGTVVTRVDSPDGSIPWLLLSVVHESPGRLDPVAYISRVNTRGGTAPTEACTPGEERAVKYGAEYVLWAPAARG